MPQGLTQSKVCALAEQGTLYIVPTPIGNLQDITQRAVQVLADVDVIAAEDTRHSKILMQHLGVSTPMLSLHAHNEQQRASQLISRLQQGEQIALISDAGTPLISDPGYDLVNQCRQQGITVVPLPGACAAITALSASGLPTHEFRFCGFLPVKQQAKEKALSALREETATCVFYESPRRVIATLQSMAEVLGEQRQMVLAKELSKTFETFISGQAETLLSWLNEDERRQKGEFVLLVEGKAIAEQTEVPSNVLSLVQKMRKYMPLKTACGIVAEHFGLKKNALYQAALAENP